MTYQHKQAVSARWNQMSLVEQMGNAGSEVERALRSRRENRPESFTLAFERALDLLELTVACPANRGRRKEPARTRELLVDYFLGDNEYDTTEEWLHEYFLQFAVAANQQRAAERATRLAAQSEKKSAGLAALR